MRSAVLLGVFLGVLLSTRAETVEVTPETWGRAQGLLGNGAGGEIELVLAGGIYPVAQALRIAGRRAVLRAAKGASPLLLGMGEHFSALSAQGAPALRIEGLHFRHFEIALALRQDGAVRVADNWFDDVHTAVVGEGLDGAELVHNRIDQAAGTPIVLRGGKGAVVSGNLIFDYLRESGGGAGILLDEESAPVVAGNLVRDQFGPGAAVWARRCSSVTVTGNVVLNAFPADWRSDENRGLKVTGNYWQQGSPAGNHLVTFAEQVPGVAGSAGLEKAFRPMLSTGLPAAAPPRGCSRVEAEAGDRSALVTWHPPPFDGGAPVLAYAVVASTGQSITISEADFRAQGYARLDELANGKPCSFTVTAVNKAGRGPASPPSAPVTPRVVHPTVPSAPRILAVIREGGLACIRYAAPASEGGARITSYTLTVLPQKSRIVFAGRNVVRLRPNEITFGVIDELAQGGNYGFTLTAVNSVGESKAAVHTP